MFACKEATGDTLFNPPPLATVLLPLLLAEDLKFDNPLPLPVALGTGS